MPLYVPKSILLLLPSFSFALGANIPFFSPSRILFSLESGHRELRVLKTGYLKTLPVILGQGCPLSADWYGVVVVVVFCFSFCTKIRSLLLLHFSPFRRYSGHGRKMITLIALSITPMRYNG